MHTLHWQVRDDKHNNAIQPRGQQEENQRAQIFFFALAGQMYNIKGLW